MTGKIKKLNEKRFGFIKPDDGTRDVFFHKSGLATVDFEELHEGDSVTFDVEQGDKGPKAVCICRP